MELDTGIYIVLHSVLSSKLGVTIINLIDEIDVLKKGKLIDSSYFMETMKSNSSATPAPLQEPVYGMSPGYFARQTPPPQTVQPSSAGQVGLVQHTGQSV
jgi:hypothetical protein